MLSSDYFDQIYECKVYLIEPGKAYVDSQDSETIAQQAPQHKQERQSLPLRSIEENLTLFSEMRAGQHDEGTHVLRAKIDMSSPNMLMVSCHVSHSFKHHPYGHTGVSILCMIGLMANQIILRATQFMYA